MAQHESMKTTLVTVRLPNDVVEILKRRAHYYLDGTLSAYLRDRIVYDTVQRREDEKKNRKAARKVKTARKEN